MSQSLDKEPNPYAPPSAASIPLPTESKSSELRLFFRWEKLRLLYNAILILATGLTLMLYPIPNIRPWELVKRVAFLFFVTNICYCLGPVIDGYARWLHLRHRVVMITLFVAGTLFAVFISVAALYSLAANRVGPD